MLGTRLYENYWRSRPHGHASEAIEQQELQHPRRAWLAQYLQRVPPFANVLEVGCGSAFNLEVLASAFPGKRLNGVDINANGINTGRERLARHGVTGVTLSVGNAARLSDVPDRAFDVVMTDGTLLYIAPDKISVVFHELERVCKRDLLFAELHEPSMAGWAGRHTRDGWLRNYEALAQSSVRQPSVTAVKIPSAVRAAGRWPQFGHLVHARFRRDS